MKEASWVPTALNPLVPPARLGALLVEQRKEQGLGLHQVARRSEGFFTAADLESVERGRITFDDATTSLLVGLYESDAGPVIPDRSELKFDADQRQLSIDAHRVSLNSLHIDDVIGPYLSLVYSLRGQDYGTPLELRGSDLAVLGETLGETHDGLRSKIQRMIEAPESVQQAQSITRATMATVAALLIAALAIASFVLAGSPGTESPTQVLGAQQFVATGFVAETGLAAEASVDFDYRSLLREWRIDYADGRPDVLGMTRSDTKLITIYVRDGASTDDVAAVLMHEVGHAIDLEYMNDTQRAEWIELRDIPATWWPGNGLSDFSVGAGDFAEGVSALTTGSPSSSDYGEFTPEQLDFVADILAG